MLIKKGFASNFRFFNLVSSNYFSARFYHIFIKIARNKFIRTSHASSPGARQQAQSLDFSGRYKFTLVFMNPSSFIQLEDF